MKTFGRFLIQAVVVLVMLLVMVMPVAAASGAQVVAEDPAVDWDIAVEILGYLGIILALAFMVETLVEFLFSDLFLKIPALEKYSWTQKYIAVVAGVAGAFIYQFDLPHLLAEFFGVSLIHHWFGIFWTGVGIGKGSNYIHDLIMRFFRGKLNGLQQYEYAQDLIENWVATAEQMTDATGAGPVKKLWVQQQAQQAGLGLSDEAVGNLIEAKVAKLPVKLSGVIEETAKQA